jgi:hypothetical protein
MMKMKKTIAFLVILGMLIFPKLTLAATFNVDRTDDTATPCVEGAGDCSLRGAIIAANQNPGLDTINIPAGEYILSIEGRFEDATATGDLDITDDVNIEGAGETQTIINASGIDRVIHILANATVEIADLTVTGGFDYMSGNFPFDGTGAGIYNGGNSYLKMRNCSVANNGTEWGTAGGIYNEKNSTLKLSNCTITEGRASYGTAILNEGIAEITDSTEISKNMFLGIPLNQLNARVFAMLSNFWVR